MPKYYQVNMAYVAQRLIDLHKLKDLEGLKEIGAYEAKVIFRDGEVSWDEYTESCKSIWEAFPDIDYQVIGGMEEKDGKFYFRLKVSGTHTGVEWAPLPHLPKIEAANVRVSNDEETLIVSVQGDKVTGFEVVSHGILSGPKGFYISLGGNLVESEA